MKRKSTNSALDLWARLATRDYVALAPDQLRWKRPMPGRRVKVRDEMILLPEQTETVRMTWAEWGAALNDFLAVEYVGATYPELVKRESTPANVPRGFAQRYGLLEDGDSMREDAFLKHQRQLRAFDRMIRVERKNLSDAAAQLEVIAPPIGVAVTFEAHRGGSRLVLIPKNLLSGLWLVAIRAATLDASPLRVCALVGCDAPLTGTVRNAFCCDAHRARARENNRAKDKRRLRDRLSGIESADIGTLADLWQQVQATGGKR